MLKKINLGCGPLPLTEQDKKYMEGPIEDWILADLFPENEEVTKVDMKDLSEYSDNHFTHIYSSHAVEHIPHIQVLKMLKDWYKKLAPEGKLTINVPDLMWCFEQMQKYENYQYIEDYYHDYFGSRGLINIIYGSQEQPGEIHFCGFTNRSLTEALEEAGFEDIEVDPIRDSHDMGVLIAICQKQKS